MRISLLLPFVLLSVTVATAQESLRLDDGGWQPVRRGGRTYLTAPMTPVRVGVRSNRPPTGSPDNQPIQVTVGGAAGNAIEASAFVRPIRPANRSSNDAYNVPTAPALAESPYVPHPVTPASVTAPQQPTPASRAYLSVDGRGTPSRSQPSYSQPSYASQPSYSSPGGSNGLSASASAQGTNPADSSRAVAPSNYADTAPRLPPTPPQWNDPALEVARQSLSATSSPQSVYWQGQTPADLPPRLPGGGAAQPGTYSAAPQASPYAPYTGGSVMAPPPQSFSPALSTQTMAPSCDAAYGASAYTNYAPPNSTPYYPRTVASPSIAAYGGAGVSPLSVQANAYGGPEIRRGLLGQPSLRVPGQPLRNFLRFVTP